MVVLPEILLGLIPLTIEKSEVLINENITKELEICRRNLPDILHINKKVNSFIRRNNDHWQKEFEERKDVYYKFTRTDQLISLYIECLEKNRYTYHASSVMIIHSQSTNKKKLFTLSLI